VSQDKLTLDEIADNDLEMVKDAITNANKYPFGRDIRKAKLFIRHCLNCTLKHLGITVTVPKNQFAKKRYEKILDEQMAKARVKIENRKKYAGNDVWRNGIYIYKDDVLVSFISNVLGDVKEEYSKDTMKLPKRSFGGLFVITNARTDNINRIYTPSGTWNNAKLLH
jgi:hypothetical protein